MIFLGYAVGFVCCVAMFYAGKWMRTHHAEFGQQFVLMPKLASGYSRIVGSFFMVMSILGMLFYAVLTFTRLI